MLGAPLKRGYGREDLILTLEYRRRLTIPKKTQKRPKTRNINPPISERPGSTVPQKLERPSKTDGPAPTTAEGRKPLASWGSPLFSRTHSVVTSATHNSYFNIQTTNFEFCHRKLLIRNGETASSTLKRGATSDELLFLSNAFAAAVNSASQEPRPSPPRFARSTLPTPPCNRQPAPSKALPSTHAPTAH
jgi:hypothetical protein